MTDAALVEQTLNGDKEAFGALVERYRHQVYALAYHHVRDFESAKDLAQESFVQAYLKLSQLREPVKFVAWLRTLTTNVCRQWLRRHEIETVPLDDEDNTQYVPTGRDNTQEQAELSVLVRRTIDALPERQRLTVTMFYIDGLSYQDIAEFMGESVNAVESRLHRARAQLKERMMDAMGETFKPHHLSEEFTDEVLKKVRVMGVRAGQPLGVISGTETLIVQDEQEREFSVRLKGDEVYGIVAALEGRQPPRPMTHDLFKRMLDAFDIKLERVVLSDVQRGAFTARMLFRCGDETRAVDARAGDAVAMAVRTDADVFATPTTLKKARRLKPPSPPEPQPAPPIEPRVIIYTTPPNEEEQKKMQAKAQRYHRQRERRWARIAWEKQTAVTVSEVCQDYDSYHRYTVVILDDEKGRQMPIWIGFFEAQAIGRALKNGKVNIDLPPAPKGVTAEFAHDLIKSVLDAFGVKMLHLGVESCLESVFYGVIALRRNGTVRYVDTRPSDGIALAVRCDCPLYVAPDVMKQMGIAAGEPLMKPHQVGLSESLDLTHRALREAIERVAERCRIMISSKDEQCRVVVKEGSKVVWEQTGGLFAECRDFLRNAARVDKDRPFPQKGAARCAFGDKHYELQVTVKEKSVELRLKPLIQSA